MIKKMKVACLQVNAGDDWRKNFIAVYGLLKKAARQRVHLAALPEAFIYRGAHQQDSMIAREITPKMIQDFGQIARELRLSILLGSVLECSKDKRRFYNTSVLLSETGKILACYRKIHLFRIRLGSMITDESKYIVPGNRVVTVNLQGVKMGLSICYDLRFPELYREFQLRGCKVVFVPANFTYETGKDHWEILLRARAIENQVFVIAPAQVGRNPSTKLRSYGNSLIVDPWGRILARGDDRQEGIIVDELDFSSQMRVRQSLPVNEDRVL
ncbi:MAG: carbon-nitrogen hydrolase family protein [Candidatus Omnitrophica bacterium]|nr:carbon-nitrogen hydrolase family protein [Candidatus Omnitrophota bacterium]